MTDPETQKIHDTNQQLSELVHSSGWRIARGMIVEKIMELQNVAEYIDVIQTGNATKLLKEMKANKRAAEILFDWLRQIEGGAETAATEVPHGKSYMYVAKDED